MKKILLVSTILFLLVFSGNAQAVDWLAELNSLVEAERAFSRTSAARGMREAFLTFLADDAILFRPHPVPGKKWTMDRPATQGLVTWEPIFADVSAAGDLGYTTGPYEFRSGPQDLPVSHGQYVTIWKKQPDGTWKVVIDLGTNNPAPATRPLPWQASSAKSLTRKSRPEHNVDRAAQRTALLNLERDFSKASAARGIFKALRAYADDDIRLFRADSFPVVGKKELRDPALEKKPSVLTWQAIAVDVSQSGDLGYTYGTCELKASASDLKPVENGYYVRIWKKNSNGRWKVVLDILNPLPQQSTSQ